MATSHIFFFFSDPKFCKTLKELYKQVLLLSLEEENLTFLQLLIFYFFVSKD